MIESNSDNSLSICVVKLKSKDESTIRKILRFFISISQTGVPLSEFLNSDDLRSIKDNKRQYLNLKGEKLLSKIEKLF
jgi:hypothetical protein